MSPSRSVGFTTVIALMLVLSGCIGGAPLQSDQRSQTPTKRATTSAERYQGTETMGEVPPVDQGTKNVLDDIRAKQNEITSYRFTITERTVTQLSNGSELTRVQTWDVAVKYTEAGTLTRVESASPDSSKAKDIRIHNATATIHYVPSEDEYRIQNGMQSERRNYVSPHARTKNGSYTLFEAPFATIKRENAVQYKGIGTINGREVYVIHLDGNPNGGNLAYYDAQTVWVDKSTGLVLKQTAQKPHLESMHNTSLAELRHPEKNDPLNDSDDGPNAVYLGDKTITTTYTNVSINDVPNSTFEPDIPEGADVEVSTKEK